MRTRAAIVLALALAACTPDSKGLLLRDLEQLAELPRKMDKVARKDVAPAPAEQAVAAAEQGTTIAAAPPEAVAQQVAPEPAPEPVPAPEPAPVPETVVASTDVPKTVPAKTPKLTLLDRLRKSGLVKTAEPEPELRGAYDQIPEPIPVENPLARPPWEVFVEAGPNAHKELDLETLYGSGNIPAELIAEQQANEQVTVASEQAPLAMPPADEPAAEAAPAEAPAKKEKKGDVVIKAVAVPAVKGARGEGNSELTAAMRNALKEAGWPVLNTTRKDALTVQGRVTIAKANGATQAVKIVWDVLTPDGKHLGDLKQDNAVPAGSLDQSWGENAQYAADAAAEGIFKLIQRYR